MTRNKTMALFLGIFLGFIFPNKLGDFLENKFSDELISNYRDDLDFQHVVDLVQTVGAFSQIIKNVIN